MAGTHDSLELPEPLASRVAAASESLGISETEFLTQAVNARLEAVEDTSEGPAPIKTVPPAPEGEVPTADTFYSDSVAELVADDADEE